MWDFDNEKEEWVFNDLDYIQERYNLPTIRVLYTGIPGHYHAYCFHECGWLDAREIIAGTPGVDKIYLAIGIIRGYFTLRISEKRGRQLETAFNLFSMYPETANAEEVASFVEYTTKRR